MFYLNRISYVLGRYISPGWTWLVFEMIDRKALVDSKVLDGWVFGSGSEVRWSERFSGSEEGGEECVNEGIFFCFTTEEMRGGGVSFRGCLHRLKHSEEQCFFYLELKKFSHHMLGHSTYRKSGP